MADSSVTTGAAGAVIDTRTAPGGDHRQVIVLGDPDAANVANVGANGALEVENVTNVGRTRFTLFLSTTSPSATDTLATTTPIRGGTAGTAAGSHGVTAGKRLRLTAALVTVRTTTTATPWVLVTVRSNPAGATVVGSPAVLHLAAGGTAAVSGNTAACPMSIEEGVEFTGTETIGISVATNVSTNVVNVTLLGYEY